MSIIEPLRCDAVGCLSCCAYNRSVASLDLTDGQKNGSATEVMGYLNVVVTK